MGQSGKEMERKQKNSWMWELEGDPSAGSETGLSLKGVGH